MRHSITTGSVLLAGLLATAPIAPGPVQAQDKGVVKETKAAVSDSWITSKAKISLFADERVKGTQVNVDTKNGVVHLRGKVDSAEAKAAAEEVAKGLDGVKSVKNDLQVWPPPPGRRWTRTTPRSRSRSRRGSRRTRSSRRWTCARMPASSR